MDTERDSIDPVAAAPSLLEAIARENRASIETVTLLFESASAALERTARIKTYITVLAAGEVRRRLRRQATRSSTTAGVDA